MITVDPVSNFAGTIRVQATVNDGQDSANQTFDVIVTAPNNAPTLAAVSNVNMLSTTPSVDVTLVGADADGDTLTYTATLVTGGGLAGASDVTLSVSGNVITVDPVSNFAGTIRVQATVSDGQDSANQTFDVIVTAPNNAPTLAAVSNVNMLSTTPSVNVTLVGADADGDTLTYTATLVTGGGLAGASDVTLSVSGNVITVDPVSNFTGTIRVQATVSDGEDSASRTFDVIVSCAEQRPDVGGRLERQHALDDEQRQRHAGRCRRRWRSADLHRDLGDRWWTGGRLGCHAQRLRQRDHGRPGQQLRRHDSRSGDGQ